MVAPGRLWVGTLRSCVRSAQVVPAHSKCPCTSVIVLKIGGYCRPRILTRVDTPLCGRQPHLSRMENLAEPRTSREDECRDLGFRIRA